MNSLKLIAAGLLASGVAFWAGQGIGYAKGYAASEAVHVAALAEAQRKNLEIEKALILGVEKVAQDAELERQRIEDRLVAANGAVGRLQQSIRDADARENTAATAVADAASARALLAHCAARYRDMARTADSLRATIIGLQAYSRQISLGD